MKKLSADEVFQEMKRLNEDVHATWNQFSKFLTKAFGKDLVSWSTVEICGKKIRIRNIDEIALQKRLVGYKVITRIERYVKLYCPKVKIVNCDDSVYAGSIILLIPHPTHGITVMFVPQCTGVQNQFFLYPSHFKVLMRELTKMGKEVYTK